VTKPAASPQYVGVSERAGPPRLEDFDDFDAVYQREIDYVCRSLGRLGVPLADLDDHAHDVFLVLHRKWNDVDHARPLRPWLFGVARRVAADARAKRRELPTDAEPPPAVEDPRVAQRDLVWRALDTLDDDRRTVVILHDLEGHSGVEIAALLDIPANTVHSRLRLARADLVVAVRKLRGGDR
jgi:RNA polymerase sigma-70 factor (ECF subfamily)